MSSLTASSRSNRGLRVLDPDLPLLATEAAIDIENLLASRSHDLTAIRRLADRLNNSIDLSTTNLQPRSLMDPATLSVLGEAIAVTTNGGTLQKLEELIEETAYIAKTLTSAKPENIEELTKARDFCVALSRVVMAYHKSIRDLRPPHPFRR